MTADPFTPRTVTLLARRSTSGVDDRAFLGLAEAAAHGPVGAVLLSGGTHERATHSLALWDPFLALRTRGDRLEWISPTGAVLSNRGDPLDLLDRALSAMRPDFPRGSLPFAGGAVGYFAYDLKNCIEQLPSRAAADPRLPDIFLFWPRRILIHERAAKTVEELELGFEAEGARPETSKEAETSPAAEAAPAPTAPPQPQPIHLGRLRSNFSRAAYLRAVRRVRRLIRQGDVYQVNLSQRFTSSLQGDPFVLWRALFDRNPAPFYAYIQAGDHQVLSTSMESFLRRDGVMIESRPIKGTRPRGGTPEEDRARMAELAASTKDEAELSMIVDLIRNDLGRVCLPGSVRVKRHRILESYANVHHMVSVITGTLPASCTAGTILRAAFPGGSITGCPKIRAMEIIDDLEPHARHVYTGAIGYLGLHGNMDLNVAIRTGLVHGGALSVSVGGGIIYDSVPEEEYEETLAKGRTFFEVVREAGGAREAGAGDEAPGRVKAI
jgi:para-aminobenzoate synthetase component 1